MTKEDITKKIWAEYPVDWDFITKMLDKETIDKTAENFAKRIPYASFDMFGLEDENEDQAKDCLKVLITKASKKMWQNISKEDANTLLGIMQKLNILSAQMMDGGIYTAEDIYKTWKRVNEKEEDNE